jgi:hypothetical protein
MRFGSQTFAIDLPDGFHETSRDGAFSAADGTRAQQVFVTVHRLAPGASLVETVDRLEEVRKKVLQEDAGASDFAPVEVRQDDGAHTQAFIAVGREPILAFCAFVATEQRVGTLCFYQYTPPDGSIPQVSTFIEEAGRLLETFTVS